MWDLDSGSELHTLYKQSGWTTAIERGNVIAFTPDGRRAAAVSDNYTFKVWDLDSSSELHTLHGHSSWVTDVVLTSDGKRAISASADRTLKVWDLATGTLLATFVGETPFRHLYLHRYLKPLWRMIALGEYIF